MSISPCTVYMLYVEDSSIPVPVESDILSPFPVNTRRYPVLWLGSSSVQNLDNVIYDKRSSYNKFKNQKRYYRSFMDIFKYMEQHSEGNPNLFIKLHTLEKDVTDIESVIKKYILMYCLAYGNNLIKTDPKHKCIIEEHIKKIGNNEFSRAVYDTSLSLEERKKLSNEKYQNTHRKRLNEKSKRYYERNKEILKEKREAKKLAAIENTAQ